MNSTRCSRAQATCTADANCKAYTYVVRPPLVGSCCLKGSVPPPKANPTCTSGVKKAPAPDGGVPLPLVAGDDAIDVRVFVDNTFIEVFIMQARSAYRGELFDTRKRTCSPRDALQGRLAFTMPLSGYSPDAGVTLFASSGTGVTATGINVWHLNSIWVSPAEVLEAAKSRLA